MVGSERGVGSWSKKDGGPRLDRGAPHWTRNLGPSINPDLAKTSIPRPHITPPWASVSFLAYETGDEPYAALLTRVL